MFTYNFSFLSFGLTAYCQEKCQNYFLYEKSLTIPSIVSFVMIDFMITSIHMEDDRLPFEAGFEVLTFGKKERIIMQRQMYMGKQQVCVPPISLI